MSTTVEIKHSETGIARVVFQSENGVQTLSRAVLEQLKNVVKELKGDKTLRVVVFEATGRTFLAGSADINEFKRADA